MGLKKLYSVNGQYVKASCGGTHILDQWDGKKENECLMIDNVEKEKIGSKQRFIRDDDKGVVLDTYTSLVWQDNMIVKKRWITIENSWPGNYFDTSGDTATTYCENLALGGYADWRLPSVDELKSVSLPHTSEQTNLKLAFTYYMILPQCYWSSTTDATYSIFALAVLFHDGSQFYYAKGAYHYVRCVRAGQ